MKKRVYISGPMRGLPDLNYTAFTVAALDLRYQGHEVVNPHELEKPDEPLLQIIERDIDALLTCDAIYMLPGWQNSIGARAEFALAQFAELEIMNPPDKNKEYPMATGCLDYFPDALAEISHVSKVATDQHHPGEPMHWDRNKSSGHADCLLRHLSKRGKLDTDGTRHSAKVAWRALAILQVELEGGLDSE